MTATARDLLDAFEALDAADRLQIAAEILRRSVPGEELPNEAFDALADELFVGFDAEEEAGGS